MSMTTRVYLPGPDTEFTMNWTDNLSTFYLSAQCWAPHETATIHLPPAEARQLLNRLTSYLAEVDAAATKAETEGSAQ